MTVMVDPNRITGSAEPGQANVISMTVDVVMIHTLQITLSSHVMCILGIMQKYT